MQPVQAHESDAFPTGTLTWRLKAQRFWGSPRSPDPYFFSVRISLCIMIDSTVMTLIVCLHFMRVYPCA
jgi:hypothetical protein